MFLCFNLYVKASCQILSCMYVISFHNIPFPASQCILSNLFHGVVLLGHDYDKLQFVFVSCFVCFILFLI